MTMAPPAFKPTANLPFGDETYEPLTNLSFALRTTREGMLLGNGPEVGRSTGGSVGTGVGRVVGRGVGDGATGVGRGGDSGSGP
eukprot:CAMPEP_0178853370 /NCGR_PEP_ID=MMETSP0746-20121128/22199_1 /TAXON_ID=913974 /ORGANISM="Nitzschia punctata, Strain CCMP561" /LENGTH=83 /DNA_ID=CAMNT_0020519157 /DNA_START=88 /DNA_END=335 /DNA_ORIENTATION=+